jgi:hypothetical protein
MKLPFDLPAHHLPVIMPLPKIRQVKGIDGFIQYEPYAIQYLPLQADRGLFEIGFMLELRQFALLKSAERFSILALVRFLRFSDKIVFPGVIETGKPVYVENSNLKLVWATIPDHVIITSPFTTLDLRDQGMALSEPEAMRETIERVSQGCPEVDIDEVLNRFRRFRTPDQKGIRSALRKLKALGIVREYIKLDQHRCRAVFNMRMVASTRSGILRGMIAAEDHLQRLHGTEVSFSNDLADVVPPVSRKRATKTGRQKKLKRAEYQAKYHSAEAARVQAEKLIADYKANGYLTPDQFTEVRKMQDNPATSSQVREVLKRIFEGSRTDQPTDIPKPTSKKGKRSA